MIFQSDIDKNIQKMESKGAVINSEKWIIAAAPDVTFMPGLYPLEIIRFQSVPEGTAYIMRRPEQVMKELLEPRIKLDK